MQNLSFNIEEEDRFKDDQDIMIMSDINDVAKLFSKEYVLIWFDPQANSAQNTLNKKKLQRIGETLIFDQFSDAYNSIESVSTNCHVILAGEEGEFLAQEMQKLDKVLGIYIYHKRPDEIKSWNIPEEKLLGIESKIEDLFPNLMKGVREKSIPVFTFPVFTTNFDDRDKSRISKLHYYLKGLVNFNNRQQSKDDLLLLAKKIYEDPLISTFEKNYKKYDMKTIFNWYTRQSFLYKITNNCLRIATSDSILYCRMVLRDLERAIKEQYQEKSKEFNGLLFRGAFISKDEWKILEGNIGKEIEMHGFLSTTKVKKKAADFLKADVDNKMFVTIIIPPLPIPDDQGFAEVREFSDFPFEEEVLFNVRSRFKILEAKVSKIDPFTCKHLVLFYGTEALQRYITESKPCINVEAKNDELIKCKNCGFKKDALLFTDLLDKNIMICDDCVIQNKDADQSTILCSYPSLGNIRGMIMQYKPKIDISFYGYKCHQCQKTAFKQIAFSIYKEGSHQKKSFCKNCFSTQKFTSIQHNEIILAEKIPWTFWSQGMLEKDKNYSDYQKDLNSEISSFIQGDIFYRTFDYEKTIQYYQHLFYQKKYDKFFDKDLCKILLMLSKAYTGLGKHKEAQEYGLIALDAHELVYGENHRLTADCYINLGNIHVTLQEDIPAILQYSNSIPIIKSLYGENHPELASINVLIASALSRLQIRENALEYFNKAFEIRKSAFGEKHPEIANSYQELADIYKNLNSYEEALQYASKAIEMRRAIFGVDHPEVADSYSALGSLYLKMNKLKEAEECLVSAVQIRISVFGEKSPFLSASYEELENFYMRVGHSFKQMASLFSNPEYNQGLGVKLSPDSEKKERARLNLNLKISEVVYGKNSPKTGSLYDVSTYYYKKIDDEETSFNCSVKALEIKASYFGELNPALRQYYLPLAESHKN